MEKVTLLIRNEQEKRRIIISDIVYVITEDYLSTFILKCCYKFVLSKPFNKIFTVLPDCFFQISRSCLVNMNEVLLLKSRQRQVVVSNFTELTVSARRIKAFNDALAAQNHALTR